MAIEFNRAHYRVTYPVAVRPTLDWEGRSSVVVDVSEHGIGFLHPDAPAEIGTIVRGILRFRSSQVIAVAGTVVRVFDGVVGVRLRTELPYSLIMEEQLYLQKRFPTRW
ncbi:MAG: PilZ domain-containing protein [Gemmatimonadota bacterium]